MQVREELSYILVASKMEELNTIFTDYYKLLNEMSSNIHSNINNGNDSALKSLLGATFLNKWDETADVFIDFKNYFDSIYNNVALVTSNTEHLEENATEMFYTYD